MERNRVAELHALADRLEEQGGARATDLRRLPKLGEVVVDDAYGRCVWVVEGSDGDQLHRELLAAAADDEQREIIDRAVVLHCTSGPPPDPELHPCPQCGAELTDEEHVFHDCPVVEQRRAAIAKLGLDDIDTGIALRAGARTPEEARRAVEDYSLRVVGRIATACPRRDSTRERRPGTPRRRGSRRSTRAGPSSSDDPPPSEPHLARHCGPLRRGGRR